MLIWKSICSPYFTLIFWTSSLFLKVIFTPFGFSGNLVSVTFLCCDKGHAKTTLGGKGLFDLHVPIMVYH